jgi:signal transduction histidine kinase
MDFYKNLSNISFLKNSYIVKFLFVAFIGIHIPLIGLLFFILYGVDSTYSPHTVLFFSLFMTLVATGATLLILKKLIKPIELVSKSLNDYKENRTIPNLPTNFTDEAGLLMRNIQESILESERFITDKQDMVYLLSHDLKNFAANPQSLATLILEENPTDTVKEYAELIYQSSSHQFLYIENFIKLLKQQDEVVENSARFQNIQIDKVISTVETQLEQLLTTKKIKLVTDIEVKEVSLRIESHLLIRVLVNLIDNAIKFSFPGSEIIVRVHFELDKLQISVSDKGIGFDQSQSDELFKKFTMMSKMGTSNEASTGIGLYLCRQTIKKSGGELIGESEGLNKGAKFTIEL